MHLKRHWELRKKHSGKVTSYNLWHKKMLQRKPWLWRSMKLLIYQYTEEIDPPATNSKLSSAGSIQQLKYDLILCGEASIDEYSFQTGPEISTRFLEFQFLTYARKIELNDGEIIVERAALKIRYEVSKTKFPLWWLLQKRINQPRIPTLLQILGASKKSLTEWANETRGGS